METPTTKNSLIESKTLKTLQQVNDSLCTVILFLVDRSKRQLALTPKVCSQISVNLARNSRALLKAEMLIQKRRRGHE